MLVDKNERYRNLPIQMECRDFWGQLLKIIVVNLDDAQARSLQLDSARRVVLGVIRRAKAKENKNGIVCFKSYGQLDIVDLNCIQCTVGRVLYDGEWMVLDRSGPYAQAVAADE
jgi:hypothetical protein